MVFLFLLSLIFFKQIYLQELGHFLAAVPKKVKLSIPYFIPNITLGSFGAITQVVFFILSSSGSLSLLLISLRNSHLQEDILLSLLLYLKIFIEDKTIG